jgi:hypothetical protein
MANISTFALGRRALFAGLIAVVCSASAADIQPGTQKSESPSPRQNRIMKIRLMVNDTVIATATLDDNESARQFAALLPLSLVLNDYAATEKVADLPGRLSTKGAPDGYKPSAGDIAYYAPWGNLAIFHKDFGYSSGLVRLGRLDSGLDAMRRPGQMSVRVEVALP